MGAEMCIRDRPTAEPTAEPTAVQPPAAPAPAPSPSPAPAPWTFFGLFASKPAQPPAAAAMAAPLATEAQPLTAGDEADGAQAPPTVADTATAAAEAVAAAAAAQAVADEALAKHRAAVRVQSTWRWRVATARVGHVRRARALERMLAERAVLSLQARARGMQARARLAPAEAAQLEVKDAALADALAELSSEQTTMGALIGAAAVSIMAAQMGADVEGSTGAEASAGVETPRSEAVEDTSAASERADPPPGGPPPTPPPRHTAAPPVVAKEQPQKTEAAHAATAAAAAAAAKPKGLFDFSIELPWSRSK